MPPTDKPTREELVGLIADPWRVNQERQERILLLEGCTSSPASLGEGSRSSGEASSFCWATHQLRKARSYAQ